MILDALDKLVRGNDLTRAEAMEAMDEIMSGKATNIQIAAFLTALRMKGETVDEIVGFATVIREKADKIEPKGKVAAGLSGTGREMLVDTAGTGGDACHTFNISTATAFVVAGAGIPVAKHGGRSASSLCGSADVIEALGVNLNISPQKVADCIDEVGIGFLFAPIFHKAWKYVSPARKEMSIRTVFNMLGPLTNPASAPAQIIGVWDGDLTEKLARALKELGCEHAFVVHGLDGLDEISIMSETLISEVKGDEIKTYTVAPEDFGMARAPIAALRGGNAKDNADIIKSILGGEKGPKRDVVIINAAAAVMAGGAVSRLTDGVEMAKRSIDSGQAAEKLRRIVEFTNKS